MTDLLFDCKGYNSAGIANVQGVLVAQTSLFGSWFNKTIMADPLVLSISVINKLILDVLIIPDPMVVTVSFRPTQIEVNKVGIPFVKWSNIGSLDFTIGKDNIAGNRPLDWIGAIYSILKLENKLIVYGSNGVSFLVPASNFFGLETIYKVGLKGYGTVTGDNTKHFFIDAIGQLWKVTKELEKLDYSEYLAPMNSDTQMYYDKVNNLVYICDGEVGYIYNNTLNSFGGGYPNITGVDYQNGQLLVVAPDDVVTPLFELCTDIYDFGNRKNKSISSVDIGTNIPIHRSLLVSIDYRLDYTQGFKTTPWVPVTMNGRAYINCFGVEFKVRIKSRRYIYFEIDYIRINGLLHNFVLLDYYNWRENN
jgi:hypothetical protein